MKTEQSESLKQKLASYLEQLPPPAARKLVSGLERERLRGNRNLPYEMILSGLRPLLAGLRGKRPGMSDPLRQFCLPFEDLLVDERRSGNPYGKISRRSVLRVWKWLERDLMPDTLPDMEHRIVEHTLSGDEIALGAAVAVLHASAASAIRTALQKARSDVDEKRRIEARLGGEDGLEDAAEIAAVLLIAPAMLDLQSALPRRIDDLDDAMLSRVKPLYDAASEMAPEEAIYIPFAVMGRLERKWQILRFVRKIAHNRDDALISQSHLGVFGELLLSELEAIADRAELKRPGHANYDELTGEAKLFAQTARGFSSEVDLRRNGEWGQRLLAARARLSASISQELSRFEMELVRALPFSQMGYYGRGGPMKPDLSRVPDKARVERVTACFCFLKDLMAVAEDLAVLTHCQSVHQQVSTYLFSYEDRLLEEMRVNTGSIRDRAEMFLNVAAGFHEALGEEETADILRRRASAARG